MEKGQNVAQFIARVELLDVGGGDNRGLYDNLHAYMAAQGFGRTITASTGEKQLPTGTYAISSNQTAEDLYKNALAAASQTGKKSLVIVAEISNWWGNLASV
jgi:hypothetical protein